VSTETADRRGQRAGAAGSGAGGLPSASLVESLRFVGTGLLPSVARGLFSPRRRWMKWLTALDTDRKAIDTLTAIRRKHGGQGARLLGGRMAVVWGVDAIRQVLDQSADAYASDSGAKGKGMSHFQPDALTLSRGEEWRDRRAFNESVLATPETIHPDADRFVAVVADEVARMRIGGNVDLEWKQFESLFDHITLRVIFGDGSRTDHELTGLLEKLMGEANRIVGVGSETDDYYEFYGLLEKKLADPEPGSLLARFAEAPQSDVTRVSHQVPHWMFAMRDTLGANTYRALATIVADPEVTRRVRQELDVRDLDDGSAYAELTYLEGCLQEAMRLWPTTPLLARETTREVTLAGEKLDEGTQVMILNAFNHRDSEAVPDADRFNPGRWDGGERDYRYNHLSNGTQDCPGGPLVSLLGKAVLARILSEYELTLKEPDLSPQGDLPTMLDFFDIRFGAKVAGQ
jgi:cytochrome P450